MNRNVQAVEIANFRPAKFWRFFLAIDRNRDLIMVMDGRPWPAITFLCSRVLLGDGLHRFFDSPHHGGTASLHDCGMLAVFWLCELRRILWHGDVMEHYRFAQVPALLSCLYEMCPSDMFPNAYGLEHCPLCTLT